MKNNYTGDRFVYRILCDVIGINKVSVLLVTGGSRLIRFTLDIFGLGSYDLIFTIRFVSDRRKIFMPSSEAFMMALSCATRNGQNGLLYRMSTFLIA